MSTTINQAVAVAKRDALIDRLMREDPRVKTRDEAFLLGVYRDKWFTLAGGRDVEFRTSDGHGWMLTQRGNTRALEDAELAAVATSGAGHVA